MRPVCRERIKAKVGKNGKGSFPYNKENNFRWNVNHPVLQASPGCLASLYSRSSPHSRFCPSLVQRHLIRLFCPFLSLQAAHQSFVFLHSPKEDDSLPELLMPPKIILKKKFKLRREGKKTSFLGKRNMRGGLGIGKGKHGSKLPKCGAWAVEVKWKSDQAGK